MSEEPVVAQSATVVGGEDRARAQLYRLLAALFVSQPDQKILDNVAAIEGDETPLGEALTAMARAAAASNPAAIDDEYHDLFIGVGRGELMPYGCYYLTGFIYEKPLARLRADMGRLGIARADGVTAPEDHIAALCEMMAGLIEGDFGEPVDLAAQRAFFDAHIGPWAGQFFADLEAAESACFYMPVGKVGHVFMEIESTAFEMAA